MEKGKVLVPPSLCPSVPWFKIMEEQFFHARASFQAAHRHLDKHNAGSRVELEGRIGTLHPQTRHFIPGVLTVPDAELLLKQLPTVPPVPIQDIFYKNGTRLRNGTVLIRKIVLHSWTFLCPNGFAFRISLSIEEPQKQPDDSKLTESFRRERLRMTHAVSKAWSYEFSRPKAAPVADERTEVEIEYTGANDGSNMVWELGYKLAHIVRSLRPSPTNGDIILTPTLTWPIEAYLV